MPKLEKSSIGTPMALVPRLPNPSPPSHTSRPLPRHSSAHERPLPKIPVDESPVDASATPHRIHPLEKGLRHVRTPSHAPFPSSSNGHTSSAAKAPANTPRTRFYSDATRPALYPLQHNGSQAAPDLSLTDFDVECGTDVIDECLHLFSDFTTLVNACKEFRVYTFYRLSGILLSAVDKCLRKLDLYPDFVRKSFIVVSAKGSVEFSKTVVKNFVDSLSRDVPEEKKQETSVHMASLAVMVWDSVRALVRVCHQEELYYTVSKELQSDLDVEAVHTEETQSHKQEISEVAAILKKSLLPSSSDGIKALKTSVAGYFHHLSGSKVRRMHFDRSHQQVDESAAQTVFTRRAVDSFILIENKFPTRCQNPNDFTPFDACLYIGREPSTRTQRRRTGLRDSHVLFTAASTLVPPMPVEHGFDLDAYRRQWMQPISDSEVVKEVSRDPVTGGYRDVVSGATFQALVQIILEKIDDSDGADLVDSFFLFFRVHTASSALLNILIAFYNQTSPANRALQRLSFRAYRRYGKMQVVKVLRVWLDSHWDEQHDKDVRLPLYDFLNGVVASDRDLPGDISVSLKSSMRRRERPTLNREVKPDRTLYPRTAFQVHLEQMVDMVTRGHDIALIDIVLFYEPGGAEELARGLTILESEYFHSFSVKEVASIRSGREPKKFKDWEKFTTAMGWWVLNSILSHKSAENRIKAMELFINVAHICMRNLRNFSSAQTITQALGQNALTRLQGTVPLISSGHKDRLGQMDDFFGSMYDYAAAMKTPQAAVPIPYLIRHDLSKVNKSCASHAHRRTKSGERMMDMHYYQGIRRCVRDLERVRTRLPIPRIKVILQWVEAGCNPYINADHEDTKMELMTKSYAIEAARQDPLRRRASWVTEEDRKRAFLSGYLP